MKRLQELWCEHTHGGGRIKRDPTGRVNWQCDKCKRWGDPVPFEQEQALLDRHMHPGAAPIYRESHVTRYAPLYAAGILILWIAGLLWLLP